jgi:uncharacterized protein YjbJ (UPF0337 family)
MNWNQIEGKWEQVKGKVKEQWGKLTDDDLTVIKGKRDQLRGKLQERYGYEKDKGGLVNKCGNVRQAAIWSWMTIVSSGQLL